MKKKNLLVFAGIASVATLALASCTSGSGSSTESSATPSSTKSLPVAEADQTYTNGSYLDVYYSYDGKYGYVDASTNFKNEVTGEQYADKDVLPLWELYGNKLNVQVRNAFKHDNQKSTAKYDVVSQGGFKSEVNEAEQIDLYGTTVATINKMGNNGDAVDLMPYVRGGYMPNLKKFLEENEAIAKQMMIGDSLYYTPYFDGYNNIERMIQMDSASVNKILNVSATGASTANYDTDVANNGKPGAATGLTKCEFAPFIGTNEYNYASDTTVTVSVNGQAQTMTVKKTTNIIASQNTLLNTGCTGKALADQFVTYLQTAYADGFTKGYYTTLADIFTSEAAAYNTDDLIALMRVFKANPKLISNNMDSENYPLIIREGADNRISALLPWMGEVFGIQGMGSETDFLFYAADGTLNDATTVAATYEGLDLMAQLYDEGLLLTNFYKKADGLNVKYAQSYFAKSVGKAKEDGTKSGKSGYALMEHDYAATQSAFNTKDENGIGTATSAVEAGYSAAELMPILSPLTYWATDSFNYTAKLNNRNGKKLIRYYEENRSLKTDSWCIPTNSDNILAAVKLMDYLLSDEGQIYNDYGPEAYWAKDANGNNVMQTYGSQTTVALSSKVIEWYGASGLDFWKFLRSYIGTTDAIGYIRTATIDYQATNLISRVGSDHLSKATVAVGADGYAVQNSSKNLSTYKFGESAPAAGLPSISTENAKKYDAITTFWQQGSKYNANAYGWVKYVTSGYGTDLSNTVMGAGTNTKTDFKYSDVTSQQSTRNAEYLYTYAKYVKNTWGVKTAIPSYITLA